MANTLLIPKSMKQFVDRYGRIHNLPSLTSYTSRVSAYGIIVNNNNLLMIKPVWADLWELSGGGVDQGESLLDGFKREFCEEVGDSNLLTELSFLTKLQCNFYADDVDEYWQSEMNFFKGSLPSNDLSFVEDKPETATVGWVPIQDALTIPVHHFHQKILRSAFGA